MRSYLFGLEAASKLALADSNGTESGDLMGLLLFLIAAWQMVNQQLDCCSLTLCVIRFGL